MKIKLLVLLIFLISCENKEYVNVEEDVFNNNNTNNNNINNQINNDSGVPDDISETPDGTPLEVVSIYPDPESGVVRDATYIQIDFSIPVLEDCAENFSVSVNIDGVKTYIVGETQYEDYNRILRWIPHEPLPREKSIFLELRFNQCTSYDGQWLDESLTGYIHLDMIYCEIWSKPFESAEDVSIIEDVGDGTYLNTAGSYLWVGTMSYGAESRAVYSIEFLDKMFNLNPDNYVSAHVNLIEGELLGSAPQDLKLDILSYRPIPGVDTYSATSLFSGIESDSNFYKDEFNGYQNLTFDVTEEIFPLVLNGETGVTFRIRGTDLIFDGNSNVRTFVSYETGGESIYSPSLWLCYWHHNRWGNQ